MVLSGLLLSAAVAWQGRSAAPPSPPIAPLPVLQGAPRWWKGNLHTHSFWSDGDDFPEMIADWYRQHGYHFLGLSDHNVLAENQRWMDVTDKGSRPLALVKYRQRFGKHWVEERTDKGKQQVRLKPLAEFRSLLEEPGKFLLVPAEEITSQYGKLPVHMNAINLRDVIKPIKGDNVLETIRVNHRAVADQQKRTERKMLAFLNHPNFGWGVTAEEIAGCEEVGYFEVFNGHPGVRNEGDAIHPSCDRIWDIVLALRLGKYRTGMVRGLATDDAHGYHTFGPGKVNPGRGWLMVKAPYLSAEALVRAIEAGHFYASSGVLLKDACRKDHTLTISIQPAPGVRYRTEFIATLKDASLVSEPRRDKDGNALPVTRVYSADVGKVVAEVDGPEAVYHLTGKELYVRARVVSDRPHANPYRKGDVELAWTQPVVP